MPNLDETKKLTEITNLPTSLELWGVAKTSEGQDLLERILEDAFYKINQLINETAVLRANLNHLADRVQNLERINKYPSQLLSDGPDF